MEHRHNKDFKHFLKVILLALLSFVFIIHLSALKADTLDDAPLTIRNFNPVNIKHYETNKWKGSVYDGVGVFEKFKTPYHGLRASIIVVLMNVIQTENVYKFVERFATEPDEKVNLNYVRAIERRLGYKGKIQVKDTFKVLDVVLLFEGGRDSQAFYREMLRRINK